MEQNETLTTFLESFQHIGIYFIDRNSMEVLYENEAARSYAGQTRLGESCYALYGNSSMCQDCPLLKKEQVSYVLGSDSSTVFAVKAMETELEGQPVYGIFVSKHNTRVPSARANGTQISRMNRALQASILSYCEINMDTLECTSIPLFHSPREEVLRQNYDDYLQEICMRYIYAEDVPRVKNTLGSDQLLRCCKDSASPTEQSIRYRASHQIGAPAVFESKVYFQRDEQPHYCSIITTDVTKEETEKMQLLLFNEVTKNAATIFQLNLTRNWCGNGSSANPTNPTAMKALMKCRTVEEYCSTSLYYIKECEAKENARAFFSRERMLRAFLEKKHTISCLFPYLTESGSFEWIRVGLNMIENPLTGDVEAIAYSENVNEQILQKDLISQVIKNDFDYLVVIDLQRNAARAFTSESQASEWIPGASEYITNYLRHVYVGDDLDDFIAVNQLDYVCEQLKNQEKYEVYYCHRGKDGVSRYKKGTYAYPQGDTRYLLFSRTDNTFVVQEQRRINEELQQALAAKEKAYHDRADFFARMSHDMRTPMNGILGIARLQDRKDAESLRYDMERILQSGEYMLNLINDSLDLQRVESGKMEIHLQPIKIGSFIDSVADMIQAAAAEKGVRFEMINRNVDLRLYMMIDPIRLKQIYVNLLNNAIKFTPPGGVVSWIFEVTKRHGTHVEYTVWIKDNGIGMSAEFLQSKLFQPFAQEANSMFSQYAGSGLGLAIVKNLVDLIGGTIEVESKLGEGTTFTLHFPVTLLAADKIWKNSQETNARQNPALLKGKTILLCEDHPLNAEITIRLMNSVGCTVVWAKDGKEGVDLFAHSEEFTYDAILMDIRMPVMDGLTAARQIRALQRADAAVIPILAMTANAFEEDTRRSHAAGMNAHLSKPINPQILFDTLLRFIPS